MRKTHFSPLPTPRRTKTGRKTPSRPRRERCVRCRERAVEAADGLRGPLRSAAGARGARGADSPAAAPGAPRPPVGRLQCVALALPEVPRTPHRTAARPLRLRHGARRGGGGSRPGGVPLVHGGALCPAAAAVPRPAGTGA